MKVFTLHSMQITSGQGISSKDDPVNLANKIQAVLPGYSKLPVNLVHEDVFLLPERLPLTLTRRLVVLIPAGEIDEKSLAYKVWQLAKEAGLTVLFLALSREEDQTLDHHSLTNLAMMTSYGNVKAHSSVSAEKDWLTLVKQFLQPGDLLVCLINHVVFHPLIWRNKLGEQLAQAIGVPVYLLAGQKIGPLPKLHQMVKDIESWATSLVLLGVFFRLQVSIVNSTMAPLSSILIGLSILVELFLLIKVNEWIG